MTKISGKDNIRSHTRDIDSHASIEEKKEFSSREIRESRQSINWISLIIGAARRAFSRRPIFDRPITTDGLPNQSSKLTFGMAAYRVSLFLFSGVIRRTIKNVRDSAGSHGGEVSYKFSQVKGKFCDQIIIHKDTYQGVCAALSALWLSKSVAGESLFDSLYVGGKKGLFQIDTIVLIKQLHIDFNHHRSYSQQQAFQVWLKGQGMQLVYISQGLSGGNPKSMVDDIMNTSDNEDYFKYIGFCGQLLGHASAAEICKQGKINFFDPNFGEFSFPSKDLFSSWFIEEYWPKSWYSKNFILGEKYHVHSYRKKAR